MSTTNAFALLSTDASDSKVDPSKKKKEPTKKAAKKPAPAPAPVPEKKKEDAKAPAEVRGSKIPDRALEQKRGGGNRAPGRKLAIQRNGNRPPKREFDRHDGTGRAHEGLKKKGAGRGNWGKITDHVTEDEKPEEKAPEPEMTEEEKKAKELLEKQRTLDQYQKEQKNVKTILRTAAPVEVKCEADEKNFTLLSRVDLVAEQEKVIAAEKGAKKAPETKKAEKAKKPKKEEAKIEIQFSEGRREHHNRETSKPVKLSTSDKEAFPSLA